MKIESYELCNSFFKKLIGCMFRRSISRPLVFTFSNPEKVNIHTFFVFFSIDILWLDSDKKVIDKRRMKPWQIYTGPKSKYIIEGKKGSFSKVKLGDKIEF